jgi:multicomponent K+:H+ antiporter subunit A
VRWIAAGLLTALVTGLGSMLLGYPFLTSYFTYLDLGWLGRLALPTAMAFDFGVFLLVVGATTLILTAIAHQSLRRPRRLEPPLDTIAAPNDGSP